MADSKISDLAAVSTLLSTDEYVLARSGVSNKITGANLLEQIVQANSPWLIDVDPQGGTNISVVGTWVSTLNASAIFNGYLTNSSSAQNDEVNFDVFLAAGTWTIELMIVKIADSGIYTVSLDGVSQGTLDGYAAGTTFNNFVSLAGLTVATSGKKRLKLKLATKNASSSNYVGRIQHIQLRRTA